MRVKCRFLCYKGIGLGRKQKNKKNICLDGQINELQRKRLRKRLRKRNFAKKLP